MHLAPAQALVLFDIDGTLIRRSGSHHKTCLVEAISRVTGVPVTIEGVDTSGMLDPDIMALMMRNAGVSQRVIRDEMPELVRRAQLLYARNCSNLGSKLCPGVRSALRRLQRAGVLMGLVTGNLSLIAWKKMERAGLRQYFRFGAFAEMAATRSGLAAAAKLEALRRGWIDASTRITLIGDHPNDVLAAKLNGIQSMAVATGVIGLQQLVASGPDVLLPDLRSLRVGMLL